MNKKFIIISAVVAILLGITASIGVFMAKRSIEKSEIPKGETLLSPIIEDSEKEDLKESEDLNPSETGIYEYMKDENMKNYPWIDHNNKRYYKQFGVFSMDPVNRTVVIGKTEEGKTQHIDPGMEYVGHAYTDELILSQNMHLSCYYVYSTKQLKYTKLENIVKDKEDVRRAGIYRDYYNNPNDEYPAPDNLPLDFLKDMKEIPFTFDSQLKPVEGAIDSLIFFNMGDGLVYSFRAYFKDGEVYVVDILYEKMYHVKNSEYYKFDFITKDKIAEELPLQTWDNVDESLIPDSVKEKLRKENN